MTVIQGIELNDPNGNWGWVEKNFPTLAEVALEDDIFVSAIVFPDDRGKTVSWNIACLAAKGSRTAMQLCEALNFLSPNHCANAIIHEGPCPT